MTALGERYRPSTLVKDWINPDFSSIQEIDEEYERPLDWLPLPVVNVGDEKFVGLYGVLNNGSNFVALSVAGAYTVDWGDGTGPHNFASGVSAYKNYAWTDVSSTTLCSRGYRQAIITVTPQAGQHLTSLNLYIKHNQVGLVNGYSTAWLDICMSGANISSLTISGTANVYHRYLEQFIYLGPNQGIISFSNLFSRSSSLQSVLIDTSSCTNLSSMFNLCSALEHIPLFNTAHCINFTSMFNGCALLKSVPLLDTSAGTNFTSMFLGCSTLKTIPKFNTSAGTIFASMFSNCASLVDVPLIDTSLATTFSSTFYACYSLVTIPLLNTSKVTTFANAFAQCYALKTIPLIDTGACLTFTAMFQSCTSLEYIPLLDTSHANNLSSMVWGCISLQSIPLLDTSLCTNFSAMFYNDASLGSVPAFNTSSGTVFTNMFYGCSSLHTIGLFNAMLGTIFTTMFTGCISLKNAVMTGTSKTISYASCELGPVEINAIYTALASGVVGQTITMTGNWGHGNGDTPSIATSKGWTVV